MGRKVTAFLIVILFASLALGQESGKLSGVVTDAETGEPLPGANVVIEGTQLGASADAQGQYTILNVPAGTYSIEASFIGYATLAKSDVRVTSGLTTRLNFELKPTAIEGQRVEVTVERALVQPTATNAVRSMSQEEFENIATREVQAIYSLQAGVVEQNGEIHIRGGRSSETGYMLEGASIKSLVGADAVVTTIPEALEEINVQAGGYSAEIGNANAGIVQQSFRTGGQQFSGSIQYETDAMAGSFGSDQYSYGYNDLTLTVGGPLISQRHRFFVAVDNYSIDNYDPMFFYGAKFDTLYDSGAAGAPVGQPTPTSLEWDSGNLPGDRPRFEDRLTINGSLLFDFNPLRFRFAFARTDRERQINDLPLWSIFNQKRLPHRDDLRQLYNLRGTYFFSNNTYVQAQVSYFDYNFEIYDPNFDKPEADGQGGAVDDLMDYLDNTTIDGDPNALYESGLYTVAQEADTMFDQSGSPVRITAPGDTVDAQYGFNFYEGPYQSPSTMSYHGHRFMAPGSHMWSWPFLQLYRQRNQSYMDYKVDFVSQMGRHELKAGGHFQSWLIRDYEFNAWESLGSQIFSDPSYADSIRMGTENVATAIRRSGGGGYGYDEFMNEVDGDSDDELHHPRQPYIGAFYINDKIEYQDIVVNAGIRIDRFHTDQWEPTNRSIPPYNAFNWTMNTDSLSKTDPSTIVQPRIGLAFPVTDQTVFHLQYGRFAQMPDMGNAYDNIGDIAQTFSGQYFITQPFAWGLDPVKTTQYEVGFQHQFTNFASFDVTAFYKNTSGQIEMVYHETPEAPGVPNYALWVNGDFTTTKGLEFTLRSRRFHGLLTRVNYTLSSAKGTNSDPSAKAGLLDQNSAPPSMIQPLTFQQDHRGSVNIDYRTPMNRGPLLGDWGANLLFTFNSGHRFTLSTGGIGQQGPNTGALLSDDPRARVPQEPINASSTPWYFNTDLRIEKGFTFGNVRLGLYAYIQNLFNRRHVLNVYYRTGAAESDGFLSSPDLSEDIVRGQGQTYVDLYRALNLENRQHWISDGENDVYGTPRQIRLGVKIEM